VLRQRMVAHLQAATGADNLNTHQLVAASLLYTAHML
jgi:hypothetical protein